MGTSASLIPFRSFTCSFVERFAIGLYWKKYELAGSQAEADAAAAATDAVKGAESGTKPRAKNGEVND